MRHNLQSGVNIVKAVAPTAGSPGTMTATEVNGSGWGRVCWVINIGAITNTGTVDAYVQESATTGGSFANTAGAALTQIADTGGGKVYTIDHAINSAKPFMKLLIVTTTAAAVNSSTAILYNGTRSIGVTQSATQAVIV